MPFPKKWYPMYDALVEKNASQVKIDDACKKYQMKVQAYTREQRAQVVINNILIELPATPSTKLTPLMARASESATL